MQLSQLFVGKLLVEIDDKNVSQSVEVLVNSPVIVIMHVHEEVLR